VAPVLVAMEILQALHQAKEIPEAMEVLTVVLDWLVVVEVLELLGVMQIQLL
jgi:hypothetical protein